MQAMRLSVCIILLATTDISALLTNYLCTNSANSIQKYLRTRFSTSRQAAQVQYPLLQEVFLNTCDLPSATLNSTQICPVSTEWPGKTHMNLVLMQCLYCFTPCFGLGQVGVVCTKQHLCHSAYQPKHANPAPFPMQFTCMKMQ